MTGRVCFLSRAGDALAGVRLVGVRTDDSWRSREGESQDAPSLRAEARTAAAWIAERTPGGGVSLLCVDVDGSNCSWLTSPGSDPHVVAAAMGRDDDSGGMWSSPGLEGASIQALAAPPAPRTARGLLTGPRVPAAEGEGQRLAVLSVPDTLARVVIDELDDRGVAVERAASLWHAMALAWDPASPFLAVARPDGHIVGDAAPVTGAVLVDPQGRLIWAWSRAGELLAGGVILTSLTGEGLARVGRVEVGRLVADWLGWSVQLGVAPVRVVCVAGEVGDGTDENMRPAQIGSAIGRAWPGASVDMAVHDDPIGATLHRLAGSETAPPEDGRTNLVALSRRPRRVHRAMYLWGAMAVVAGAAGFLGVGMKAWANAGIARERQGEALAQTRTQVLEAAPPPQNDAVVAAIAEGNPRKYLEDQIAAKRREVPTGLPAAKPILSELESLSFVLGNEDIELVEIRLSDSLIHVQLYVTETRVAEDLKESLERVANDHCEWKISYPQQKKNNMQLIWLEGTWKSRGGGGAGS